MNPNLDSLLFFHMHLACMRNAWGMSMGMLRHGTDLERNAESHFCYFLHVSIYYTIGIGLESEKRVQFIPCVMLCIVNTHAHEGLPYRISRALPRQMYQQSGLYTRPGKREEKTYRYRRLPSGSS